MKAVVIGPDGLTLKDMDQPTLHANQVLVKVRAAALNRIDLQMAEGMKHGTSGGFGSPLGIEWSGTVAAIGMEVPAGLSVGDAVMCSGVGGYAEFAATDWGRVHKLPDGFGDLAEAATLPVALQTAHEALVGSGKFKPGHAVLVLGASSAVGLMAMQIARHLDARIVIGGGTSPGKFDRLREFGMQVAVDLRDREWPKTVLAQTDDKGADVVVDMVSGSSLNPALAATRLTGSIVNVGRLGGATVDFNCDLHSLRRIRYVGASFRSRTLEEVRDVSANMRRDLWQAVSSRALRMPVAARYPLARFEAALSTMRGNTALGKIILDVAQ